MPPGARASRNCGNCRAIKRRCDKQIPTCGQCIRAHDQCSGYRDEWELLFHDQTSQTIKRSKEKMAQSSSSKIPSKTSLLGPSRSPSLNTDDIGVNYFLCHFVVGGSSPSRGYLNYVPGVFNDEGEQPTLVASMAAVGLVALANSTKQPELAHRARTKYWEAINNVNAALASPVESVKDSTLMSVISLTLFEHVSNFDIWFRHIKGAVSLVISRGKSQFSRPVSVLMFNQVRADMSAACVHALEPLPEEMLELQDEAAKHPVASSGFWHLGRLATRVTNILAGVRLTTDRDALVCYLKQSTVLLDDFKYVLEIFTKEEPYMTVRECGGDPEIFYNSRYDIYKSSWAIRIWNNSRILQVIVCEILFHLLTKGLTANPTPDQQAQIDTKLQETLRIMSTLGDDILATVPQAFGYVPFGSEKDTPSDLSAHGNISGMYLMTWCLYTVGKSPVSRSKTRQWIMNRLRDIGQTAGIAMALQFVDDIDEIDSLAGRV
ncbi:hypothetical protein N7532_011048 [Penicillium argentinense]|uniref:Zn(2)-C6 fungal-type domain-containing protein n=1 Tax=Penicillium argentinense TaxID=1131581 RepID=A0A9W9JUJ2_9EURO|nr:uncharacterized protein N7532_011048 [Penicillium argentinense]KAJ5082005.1 hypothetical protein N7532_011048 [Penicillium argentinense]